MLRPTAQRCLPGKLTRRIVGLVLLFSAVAYAGDEPCVGFAERTLVSGGTNGVEQVRAADLNGDGFLDLLTASATDDQIAWFRNDGASPPGFTQYTISLGANSAADVLAADIDGDGDLDVVSASRGDDTIAWYENNGATPVPDFRERSVSVAMRPVSIHATDMDADGDIDLIAASFDDNSIAWYENEVNEEDPSIIDFTRHVVTDEGQRPSAVFAADIDGDADIDVIGASQLSNSIVWYERVPDPEDETQTIFSRRFLSTTAQSASDVFVADLDGDDDLDVLSASSGDGKIVWYENDGFPFVARTITDEAAGASSVFAVDLDGDNRLDVLSASSTDGEIVRYLNNGATPPVFVALPISAAAPGASAVGAADIDDDGVMDVISASSEPGYPAANDKIALYLGPAYAEQVVGQPTEGSDAVVAVDLDGDGDTDFVAAIRDAGLSWFDNGGTADFTPRQIADPEPKIDRLQVTDLDDDGFPDLLASSTEEGTILWYRHLGTDPPTLERRSISTVAPGVSGLFVVDFNDDGRLDLLAASQDDDTVALYQADAASPPGFVREVISDEIDGASGVAARDLDGDGDLDLLTTAFESDEVAWWENDEGTLTPTVVDVSAFGASSIDAIDLDQDGDLDLLVTAAVADTVAWYENLGPDEEAEVAIAFDKQLIAVANFVTAARPVDLDDDGDLDLLLEAAAEIRPLWLENNGELPPLYTRHQVPGNAQGTRSIDYGDFDGNGELDLVSGLLFEIAWYERVGETCEAFDANADAMLDGVELSWLGRAFGLSSMTPATEWWFLIDFNQDGVVDGDDLAILSTRGVWGETTGTCRFTCQ